MAYRLFGILLLCFSPVALFANEIMFEGYYRIELANKPIGYTILRYTFDPTSQTFEVNSFLRAKFGDQIVQESLKGKANDKFHPISYAYTSQVGSAVKMIDGSFKGEMMTLKINDGKKVKTEIYKVPAKTFLSSFLPYLLLQQKLKVDEVPFKYSAVAEEDGNSYWGKAWLISKQPGPAYDTFTIRNEFKGEEFDSKMAVVRDPKEKDKYVKAEVLSTNSQAKNISTKLMFNANQATEGQLVPNKTLLTVFGGIPTGKINMVATPPDSDAPAQPGQMIASPVPKAAGKKAK